MSLKVNLLQLSARFTESARVNRMSLKVNPVQDEDYGMDFDDGVLTEEEREELAAESEEENAKR